METIYFAMGCFWGGEKLFWGRAGVSGTRVGYMGGQIAQPTYKQVCLGVTGHAETIAVTYDPAAVTAAELLKMFWENHDPTTPDRQGNDVGTQYRSAVFTTTPQQLEAAEETRQTFQSALTRAGRGKIVTEIKPVNTPPESTQEVFWEAEAHHQRYLEKNPAGYCPVHATGVTCN